MIDCYTCSIEGREGVFHAAQSHFKMEQNGPEGFDSFFIPLSDEEKEQQRQENREKRAWHTFFYSLYC